MIVPTPEKHRHASRLDRALRFAHQFNQENPGKIDLERRSLEIRKELQATSRFHPTRDELAFAAQVGWRNATRCIGRIYWKSLHLMDRRGLRSESDIFRALLEHLAFSTNGGNIRSTLSVFDPDILIWNDQLIRYAGYRQADGQIVGDPDNVDLTDVCRALGWSGSGGRFDVLPIIIQVGDSAPRWFSIPESHILRVPIRHPEYPFFVDFDLEWYALPAIAGMELHFGGITFPCAPFSGWYMGTEIGARNLADANRYNMLPAIAEKMGLDTTDPATLWKDRALVELNRAVLHSYQQAGVKILDHHTASDLFDQFEKSEARQNREVKGEWSWLVPPISGSTSCIFHRSYDNAEITPNYFYRAAPPWQNAEHRKGFQRDAVLSCPFHQESDVDSSYREPR